MKKLLLLLLFPVSFMVASCGPTPYSSSMNSTPNPGSTYSSPITTTSVPESEVPFTTTSNIVTTENK